MRPIEAEARFVAAARARAPRAWVDLDPADCQQMIDRDQAFALRLLGTAAPAPMTRIWINRPCLVASSSQARHPCFATAANAASQHGWSVAIRKSSGTAVVHRPGVVNVSLFLPGSDGIDIRAGYEALLGLLIDCCADLGVTADMGWVPGAICNGRYNLRHGRRKLAGTAAFVKANGAAHIQVAHASITVTGDLDRDLAAIGAFDHALGRTEPYIADEHISLEQAQRAEMKSILALANQLDARDLRRA